MSNRQQIKTIFNRWASTHPSPNDIFYNDGVTVKTVAEFASEVMRETPLAKKAFLDVYEQKVNRGELTLQQIQRAFTHH